LPACGIVLAALPFVAYLYPSLKAASPHAARLSAGAFIAGIIALICAYLVVPQHVHGVLGIRRLHEFIARSTAGLIVIGMLTASWCALKGFRKNLLDGRLFWSWFLVTLLPLVGIFLSESLLVLTRLKLEWAMPIRNALRHSVFWHLGFWEWSGSVAVFVFLLNSRYFGEDHIPLISGRIHLTNVVATPMWGIFRTRYSERCKRRGYSARASMK